MMPKHSKGKSLGLLSSIDTRDVLAGTRERFSI